MADPQKLGVFLCHSSTDKPVVRDLYKRLSTEGWVDPWLDSEKLLPGQDWNLEIEKAVEAAKVVIVLLSRSSIDKEGYVQRELRIALDIALEKPEGTIFIIPLRLEELELPRRLKIWQYVDYFPKNKRFIAYERLLESLRIRATKLGISQNIEAQVTKKQTNATIKKPESKKFSKIDIPIPRIITSNAEFPIVGIPFSQNRNFSGRKDALTLIRDEFTNPQSSIPICAVTGLGGIGKTQIAVQYSYLYAKEYDLVWWIRSETDASISADYQLLSNALLLPVKTTAEQIVFVNLVNNFLENTERKWLLVFDNVESQEKIEKLLPKKGNGHILVTSQRRDWSEIANDSHLIPFSKEEGREFLNRRINEKNIENSDSLTDLLDGLPLALEQACAYISRHGTPVETYIKLFQEQQKELQKIQTPPKDYHSTLTTTWGMAFTQIRQTQPVAEELLNVLGFFAPDGIPISVFKSQANLLPENMRKVINSPVEFEECLAALYDYSLIEREGDLISIHRLVQDVVRSNLSSENLEKYLSLTVQIMEKAFPFDEYDINTWQICARLLPHALTASGYAEKYSIVLELSSDIYQKTGEYLRGKADYQRASDAIEHALNIRQEMFGTGHEKLAESESYLGEIQHEKASFTEAHKLYNAALEIFRANSPTRYLARNLNNLGAFFHDQGDFENARKYHEEALAIRRTVSGENHPDTAMSLHNLGTLFRDQSDFENARKYYEEALAIERTVLGENHPGTAKSLGNLGMLFQDQGDFENARKYQDEALAIRRNVLGENHPDTAMSLNNLGTLFREQSDFENAWKYQEEALAIQRTVLGENHPSTAKSLGNLGVLFGEQGDFENARKYHEESLAIVRTVLGENHPDYAIQLNNIGNLLIKQSKYVEARHYLEQALSVYEKAYGTAHHTLISILSNLATDMFHLRLYPQARDYASRAMKICQEAKDKYAECEKIKQFRRSIPMAIGKKKH